MMMFLATFIAGRRLRYLGFQAEDLRFADDHARHVARDANLSVVNVYRDPNLDPLKAGMLVDQPSELER